MNRWILLLAAALLAMPARAEDDGVKNGDFEKGKFGWDSTPGVRVVNAPVPERPLNRALEFNLLKNEKRRVWQRIAVPHNCNLMKVSLKMKAGPGYKAAAPPAEQYTMRYERRDGSGVLSTRIVEKKPEWTEVTWDMTDFSGSQSIVFSIEIHPGEGSVLIDDVKIIRFGG